MAKVPAEIDHALTVIAYQAVASDLSKNVKGMEGFRDSVMKKMPAKDRAILRRFDSICRIAYIDLASAMEQELNSNGQQHP